MVTLTPRVGIYGPSGARFIQPRSPSRHCGKSGRSAISPARRRQQRRRTRESRRQPDLARRGSLVEAGECDELRIVAPAPPVIGATYTQRPPERLGGPHVQQRPRLLARSTQGPNQTRPRLWEESSPSQSSTPRSRRRSASVTRSSPSCTSFNGWSHLSSSRPKEGTWIARHGDSYYDDVPNGQRAHVQ
jgi:hypothetical protein